MELPDLALYSMKVDTRTPSEFLSLLLARSTIDQLSFVSLPSNDANGWYYPSHGYDTDAEDDENRFSSAVGNWGKKSTKDARWIRRGKMVAWGPGVEEWQVRLTARSPLSLSHT